MSWADTALQRKREQEQKLELERRVFLEKQELKRIEGPRLWAAVRVAVERNCAELNRKAAEQLLVFRDASDARIEVALRDGSRILRGSYSEGALSWGCIGAGPSEFGDWRLEVDNAGAVHFQDKFGPVTNAEIAAELLLNTLFR